jgi:hypothetical protein
MGLLSVTDAIPDRPIEEILSSLPISADIRTALSGGTNRFRDIYDILLAYERADWPRPDRSRHPPRPRRISHSRLLQRRHHPRRQAGLLSPHICAGLHQFYVGAGALARRITPRSPLPEDSQPKCSEGLPLENVRTKTQPTSLTILGLSSYDSRLI